MRHILILILILILLIPGFAQELPAGYRAYKEKYPEGPVLNQWDSLYLMNIPEKKMPAGLRSDQLPPVVDNSTLPYLRPVFEQQAPSCGQAAMVGYNFTYEMAYLRDQPAMFPQTQYPTHFTYNFQNGGNGWYGVSYFHSVEILRLCGCMNSFDYGDYYDDGIRWIDGYDLYYNGMYNRAKGVYSIKTGTEEGILALKHWLYDHMGEGNYGGVASYYANTPWNAGILNDTTPEGGKHVVFEWYPIASHAMTIVGYNDSIRWDYNHDGQYTNHIDLNGDGILDSRDWEIGAVKFVNSHGIGAQDQGFCYMMYKCLSETFEEGGVWNREVHVLDIDENYQPLMTYKITLKHDKRNMVKILAGVSQDTSDLTPAWIMDFPIIDFQGDKHYLQGQDTAEYLKSLEFGLDITPLLSYIQPGEPAKFFFIVDEKDPFGEGEGQITAFSLMDYTADMEEIISPETPQLLENDSRTIVSLIHFPDFDKVEILTDTLPVFLMNEPYSTQLEAGGGSAPYSWEPVHRYRVEQSNEDFPWIDDQQILNPTSIDSLMPVPLEFSFPFYGEMYDTVWMHINGHLQLNGNQLSWPYLQEPELQFRSYRLIAPVEFEKFTMVTSDGDGGWAEITDSSATFRWQLSLASIPATTEVNFAVRILKNGNIEFIHGTANLEGLQYLSGISEGNKKDFIMSPLSGANHIPAGKKINFHYQPFHPQLSLSETGLLTGLPGSDDQILDLSFRVADDHGLSDSKTLQFTSGPYLYFTVHAGDNDRVDFGDTVSLDLEIRNGSMDILSNTTITLISADPYIGMNDATCSPGTLLPGQVMIIPAAFQFDVALDVPDLHDLLLMAELVSDEKSWHKELKFKSHAPVLQVKQYIVDAEYGLLNPGDTAPLIVTLQNTGNAALEGISATLTSLDPEVQVLDNPVQDYGMIGRGMSASGTFTLHADESVPDGFFAQLLLTTSSLPGLGTQDTLTMRIGRAPVLVIDMDPWQLSGPEIFAMLEELSILASHEYNITMAIHNYQSLFICLGYQYSYHVLTLWEGQKLAEYLDGGGKIYMEGRKTWRDDPGTPVHPKFSLATVQGVGIYDTINGIDGVFTQGLSFLNEASAPFSFYYMEPVTPAFSILHDNDTYHSCAIAHDAGTYKTIGALFEYGTMADISADATRNLMVEYLEFFGIEVEPVVVEEQGSMEAWKQGSLQVWPNPACRQLTVDSWQSNPTPSPSLTQLGEGVRVGADGRQLAIQLTINDLFGRKIMSFGQISAFPYQIDISTLPPGMYIVRMTTEEGLSGSAKFLKVAE